MISSLRISGVLFTNATFLLPSGRVRMIAVFSPKITELKMALVLLLLSILVAVPAGLCKTSLCTLHVAIVVTDEQQPNPEFGATKQFVVCCLACCWGGGGTMGVGIGGID